MPSPLLFRIEACNPGKKIDWFTVHGFQGAEKRQQVIDTARSMRNHMDDAFVVRIIERRGDDESVIWKE
jgi:hypothetical protein